MKGQDGLTRAAVVRVASCDQQQSILKRPEQLLYLIEIRCESAEITPSETPVDPELCEPLPEDDVTEQVHPKRAASKKADKVRREWIAELEKDDCVPTETIDW